jgi:hypothetical protein
MAHEVLPFMAVCVLESTRPFRQDPVQPAMTVATALETLLSPARLNLFHNGMGLDWLKRLIESA